jgi:hypothetical protein
MRDEYKSIKVDQPRELSSINPYIQLMEQKS